MPLYNYKCPFCGLIHEEFRSMSERNEPGELCACGESLTIRTHEKELPAINTSESATALDGSRKKEFQDLREANKLTIDSFNMPPEKRDGINKEIQKLEKAKS